MRLVVTLRAKLDLERERDTYETQREGLGAAFLEEIEGVVGRIVRRPLSFPRFSEEEARPRPWEALPVSWSSSTSRATSST